MGHLDTITNATTTAELATALDAFTDLRIGAAPGVAPGVRNDAPDGHYFNGYHFFTKAGGQLTATPVTELPQHTVDLWNQLREEQRDQREHDTLTAEQKRGRGRPRKGSRVPVRLPDWQIRSLDIDAAAAGVDRADLLRALVRSAYRTLNREVRAGADRAALITALLGGVPDDENVTAGEPTYHVEVLHPESATWTHVHGVDWETTGSYPDAWIYAIAVGRDNPGSRVRVAEVDRLGTQYLHLPDAI